MYELPEWVLPGVALVWANRMRREMGRPTLTMLPRGLRGDSNACPLARATGLTVDGSEFYPRSPYAAGPEGVLPSAVYRFASLFDQGRFPGLVEPA